MEKNSFKGNSIFQNDAFFTRRIYPHFFYSYTSNFLVSCTKKKIYIYTYNNNSIKIIEK